MFFRDYVKASAQAPFEKRKGRFNCVGVRQPDSESPLVDNHLVLSGELALEREYVYRVLVGVDRANVLADIFFQHRLHYPGFGVGNRHELEPSAALNHSHYDVLWLRDWPRKAFTSAGLRSDESFIGLDIAAQEQTGFYHGLADSMAEVPR